MHDKNAWMAKILQIGTKSKKSIVWLWGQKEMSYGNFETILKIAVINENTFHFYHFFIWGCFQWFAQVNKMPTSWAEGGEN